MTFLDIFQFLGCLNGFFGTFWDFFKFLDFFGFLRFWEFFNFSDFFGFVLEFFSKLLRLLLKVTEVTTGHPKWPKVS